MLNSLPDFIRNRPRSRIVCTLGPASETKDMIREMIVAGMSVARINTSHSTLDAHRECVKMVREISEELGVQIGILADLPGPKYRVGILPDDAIEVRQGQEIYLADIASETEDEAVPVHPAGLSQDAQEDDQILIADGMIAVTVRGIEGTAIRCEVTVAGVIESRKAVAIPGRTIHLPYLTEDTTAALDFAVKADVDFIGLSYVRSAGDLEIAKSYIAGRSNAQLIAKIELKDALDTLEEITSAADGLMVARGDLGVELPMQEVPGAQKKIVDQANRQGKVVITATQMLESMIVSESPTRAEVADIYNAVLDGSDAVMLSAETSIGAHPIAAIEVMAETAREAEKTIDRASMASRLTELASTIDQAIASTSVLTASRVGAKAIMAFTESGTTAARVASFRPVAPLIALYREPAAGRALSLRWGVTAIPTRNLTSIQWMFHEGSRVALETGYASDGDLIVVVLGLPPGASGNTNLLRVVTLPEPEPTFDQQRFDEIRDSR